MASNCSLAGRLPVIAERALAMPTCPCCGATLRPHHCQPFAHPSPSRLHSCARCRVQTLHPQPSGPELNAVYGETYFASFSVGEGVLSLRCQKRNHGQHLLRLAALRPGNLLDIGSGTGELLEVAREQGWQVLGVDLNNSVVDATESSRPPVVAGDFVKVELPRNGFDLVTAVETIEHLRDPVEGLVRIRELLAPGGLVLLTTPDCTSLAARLLGRRWFHYHSDHIWYFSPASLTSLLGQAGFIVRSVRRCWKRFTARYILSVLQQPSNDFPGKWATRALAKSLPRIIADSLLPPLPEGLIAIAQRPRAAEAPS